MARRLGRIESNAAAIGRAVPVGHKGLQLARWHCQMPVIV